ncbi:MAG: hypothetical protein AB7K09_05510 [Planctomycetota bacterium]
MTGADAATTPASDAPPPPPAAPAPPTDAGSDTSGRADVVEMLALFVGALATLAIVASLFIIRNDRQWDEARRVLQASQRAVLQRFRDDKAHWETQHEASVKQAEEELQRLTDRAAPAAEIDAARKRLDSLVATTYVAPKKADDVIPGIDGGAPAVALDVKTGDLTWFKRGQFIFHEYKPANGVQDHRNDEFGRYWFIEVLIEAPKPAANDNAAAGDNAPAANAATAPPSGRARIYADGTLAGPFRASDPVPDGHPVIESAPAPPGPTPPAQPGRRGP